MTAQTVAVLFVICVSFADASASVVGAVCPDEAGIHNETWTTKTAQSVCTDSGSFGELYLLQRGVVGATVSAKLVSENANKDNKKILIVGDSNGECSGTSLEQFCSGVEVKNAAVAGSTAVQWSSGDWLNHIGSQACGGTPDVIWLSVGANDNLATKCTESADDLAAKITGSINAVKAKAPNAKIVMMGYCMPATSPPSEESSLLESDYDYGGSDEGDGDEKEAPPPAQTPGCGTPEKTQHMTQALRQAADADESVTFIDSTSACGGSATAWSPGKYFQDGLHLNGKGYCKLFQQQAVQSALGCETTSESDCEQADDSVAGLDKCLDSIAGDSTTGGGGEGAGEGREEGEGEGRGEG